MKKIFTIATIFLAISLASCQKDAFTYSLFKPDTVDSIYFSTGSTKLIADGRARLDFVIETFRKLQITTKNGTIKDSMVFVDYNELPSGSLKIFDDSGNQVGLTYSTNNPAPGTVSFYAQVGNTKSATKMVTLRTKPDEYPKMTIDVIFHNFDQSKTDKFYDPYVYQPVTIKQLEIAIKDLNDVFNNRLGYDSNGGSANVEFRLATTDPSGKVLVVPGLDNIVYDNSIKQNQAAGFYSVPDFQIYVNKNASTLIWDPQKYLNIYVIPSGANNSMYSYRPFYQFVPPGKTYLPGITRSVATANIGAVAPATNPALPSATNGVVTSPFVIPKYWETVGCIVPNTLFFPGSNRRVSISPQVGVFFSVMATQGNTTYNDYCTDTRIYNNSDAKKNSWTTLIKTGINGEKFMANNAMDDIRYPSLRNTFTVDQVYRIRWVLSNCPGRNCGVLVP